MNPMETPEGRLSGEALVAHNLRVLRKAARLSQEDVAERMNRLGFKFHQTQVAKIERNARPVRYDEVIGLAKALGVPLFPFMTEAVASEGEPEYELQEAAFRVEAADQEWRNVRDLEQAAKARLTEAEREYAEIAKRLGIEAPDFQPDFEFYPAPDSPDDPLKKDAGEQAPDQ